ncbi:hypothetical protein, partial [Porphyromonas crevioricanis]|uniref:hypothetical protein n=1 Tax=Porphyromonas crevioricanis TaxID=393921 RepID=UPI001F2C1146
RPEGRQVQKAVIAIKRLIRLPQTRWKPDFFIHKEQYDVKWLLSMLPFLLKFTSQLHDFTSDYC